MVRHPLTFPCDVCDAPIMNGETSRRIELAVLGPGIFLCQDAQEPIGNVRGIDVSSRKARNQRPKREVACL